MKIVLPTQRTVGLGIFVISLILCSIMFNKDNESYNFIASVETRNTDMLEFIATIRMTVSSVSSMDIPLASGQIALVDETLQSVEKYLLYSSLVSIAQRAMLDLVGSDFIIYLEVICLILLLVPMYRPIVKPMLVVFLLISPGLAFYSIMANHISTALGQDMGSQLYSDLSEISSKIETENAKLLKEHKAQLNKLKDKNVIARFFGRIESEIVYDAKRAFNDISGEYQEIRKLIKMGGSGLLKGAVYFSAQILIFSFVLPLIYFALLVMVGSQITKRFSDNWNSIQDDWNTVEANLFSKPKDETKDRGNHKVM